MAENPPPPVDIPEDDRGDGWTDFNYNVALLPSPNKSGKLRWGQIMF